MFTNLLDVDSWFVKVRTFEMLLAKSLVGVIFFFEYDLPVPKLELTWIEKVNSSLLTKFHSVLVPKAF